MSALAELASAQGDDVAARALLYDALRIRCRLGDSQGICATLERISGAATPDDADRAARILAAAAAMRERTGARLSLTDQAQLDQQLASLQNVLGNERFQRAWRDGRSSSLDDAVMDAAALAGRWRRSGGRSGVRRLPGRARSRRREAVRLSVDLVGQFGAGRLDQAVDPAGRLVEPVAHVTHVVLGAHLQIALMRRGDGVRCQAGYVAMCIQIRRHPDFSA